MSLGHCKAFRSLAFVLLVFSLSCAGVSARVRYYDFKIQYLNVTRLCHTKTLVSVNGQYPGPTQYVREGDRIIVNVTNLVSNNITIHWHGVRQLLTSWADGPAYITQCPIQPNQSYVYRFQIIGQRGTLFYHAHESWLRATVHGAFIMLKPNKTPFPFNWKHQREIPPIVLGEWWNADVEAVISQALYLGGAYNISDALTINGQPGDLYGCSATDTVVYNVTQGETLLLRIINAGMNFHLMFAVANHSLTVVEADAEYTKPYTTDVILIAPGQTTNVLLKANNSIGQYYMAASVHSTPNATLVPYPPIATTAILKYNNSTSSSNLVLPTFPVVNDSNFLFNFTNSIRGRTFTEGFYYSDVPKAVDVDLLHTVGYALQPCPAGRTCQGPNDTLIRSSISNITFVTPNTSILQAYYNQINGVYTSDFPDVPLYQYNYSAVDPAIKTALPGTRVRVIPFNTTVQVVWQGTATLFTESHPIHLHGQSFYIVGYGNGTYDPNTDPANFNLIDPPARNTISVPPGGWAAVRFQAINPGVWFVHCHFDIHQSWGMDMAFVTLNGVGPSETLPPPPPDLPQC